MVEVEEGLRPESISESDTTSPRPITPESIRVPLPTEQTQVTDQSRTTVTDFEDEKQYTPQQSIAAEELLLHRPLPLTETSQQLSKSQPPEQAVHIPQPNDSDSSPSIVPDKDQVSKPYYRAEAIFKEYNIDFSEADWTRQPRIQIERVHKAPKMRVRWTCHECNTSFGHDRTCVECAHHRCRKCPRYPPKRRKHKTPRSATEIAAVEEEARGCLCHECQTAFDLEELQCSNCHHQMCERCLQESATTAEQFLTQGVMA